MKIKIPRFSDSIRGNKVLDRAKSVKKIAALILTIIPVFYTGSVYSTNIQSNNGKVLGEAVGPVIFDAKIRALRPVAIVDNNKRKIYQSYFEKPEKIFEEQNIKIYPEDKIQITNPFRKASISNIGKESVSESISAFLVPEIVIKRATPVIIKVDGKTIISRTWKKTVIEVLIENEVKLGLKDKVSPSLNYRLKRNLKIQVIRVKEAVVVSKVSIPYKTITLIDPKLSIYDSKTKKSGTLGTKEQRFRVIYENGVEIKRILLAETIIKFPVNKLVVKGAQIGVASWYGISGYTAAHRTLPFGTKVKVTNLANGKSVIVTIVDRGPFVSGRIIDLSTLAFSRIASLSYGLARVRVELVS